jgi:hypothetical protein
MPGWLRDFANWNLIAVFAPVAVWLYRRKVLH